MAITFPNSPSSGDTHTTSNGLQYTYDGEKWTTIGTNSAGTWTRSGTTVSLTTAGDDLNVDSGTLFVDASTNNVGVGTTSPDGKLTLPATASNTPALRLQSASSNTDVALSSYADANGTYAALGANYYLNSGGNGAAFDTSEFSAAILLDGRNSGSLQFLTNSSGTASERLRIDSSGRMLLGTTTEGEGNADDLTVATSGHTGMTIRSGTANRGNIYFSDGTSGDAEYRGYIEYNHDGDKLSFGTANGTRLHINSAGRVGIGTVSPSESLEVAGNGFKVSGQTSGVTDEGITFDWDSGSNNGRIFSESAGSSNLLFYTTASGSRGERMRIDSSGNLGLGTSSPEGVLSIYGTAAELPTSGTTSNALIELSSNLGNRLNIGLNTATGNYGSYIQASDNNLAVNYSLNLQPNGGNVGIGHSSPQFGLTLPQVSNDSGKIGWEDSGNTKRASITCSSSSDALQFHTGSSDSERMRIDSSGTVGINNDIVIGNQSASGTSGTGRFVATGGELYIQGALAKTTGSAAPIIFSAYNGVNERMRIDSAGNVAIGTTSPDTKLQIENGSISVGSSTNTNSTNTLIAGYGYILSGTKYGNTSIRSTYSNSNNSASLEFYTASSGTATAERMRIDSSGNVGVNTSSPTSQSGKALHIAGDTGGQARIHLTTSYSGHTANDGAYLVALGAESGSSAGTLAIMNYENSPTTFFTNSTERMRILSSGGLTFNGDTAQANALDDYEEGGWTPTIGKNSGTVSVTYTKQHGVYTKIGNLVLIWWDVQVSAISGGSGVGLIRSLPFTAVVASSGGGYGAPQFRDQNLLSTDSKLYSNSSYHSGTDIYLLHHNSSGTEVSTSFNASGRITGWSVYRTST